MKNKKSAIYQEAEKIAEIIGNKYKPEKIILFGSIVDGKVNSNSDIDLLVIKETPKKRAFRTQDIFKAVRNIDRQYALDPIVYTPEELEKRSAMGDYFVDEVLKKGRVLYG